MGNGKRWAFGGPVGALVVAAVSVAVPVGVEAAPSVASLPAPQRLVDTRVGSSTADGGMAGIGPVLGGTTVELPIAGRAGIPADARTAALTVTVIGDDLGFASVFPCDESRPNSSTHVFQRREPTPNVVLTRLDGAGATCFFSSVDAELIVDATGWLPDGSYDPLESPARLADTRSGAETVDGVGAGGGELPARGELVVPVEGRVGIDAGASVVALNVTVLSRDAGFAQVYSCDRGRPGASSLNFGAGDRVANLVVARPDGDGRVCIYVSGRAHLVVDVAGSIAGTRFDALPDPQRLLDTRPAGRTIDGDPDFEGIGSIGAGETLALRVGGRGGLAPDSATTRLNAAAMLNVASVRPVFGGFLTVFPCDAPRPLASSVNFRPGEVVSQAVFSALDDLGRVCIYASSATDLVIDASGTFPTDDFVPSSDHARIHSTYDATVDGIAEETGDRTSGVTLQLPVAGRAGVPETASAAVVRVAVRSTVTVTDLNAGARLWPRGGVRPAQEQVVGFDGETGVQSFVVPLGVDGDVCASVFGPTEMSIDLLGYVEGPPTAVETAACPLSFGPQTVLDPFTTSSFDIGHTVGDWQIPPGRYVSETGSPGLCELSGGVVDLVRRMVIDVEPGGITTYECTFEPYVPGAGAPLDPGQPAGFHVVGDHVAPGSYEAEGDCIVERRRSFVFPAPASDVIERIETSAGDPATPVTVAADDVGLVVLRDGGDCTFSPS